MNSPLDFRADSCLKLLKTLQEAIAAFAQREEKLQREVATRRASASRRSREARSKAETWYDSQIAAAKSAWAEQAEALKAKRVRRKEKIQSAFRTSLQAVQKQARQRKERFVGDLQMRHFRAERKQPEETQELEQQIAQFNGALAQQLERLRRLQHHVRRAFFGYGAFRRLIPAALPAIAAESAGPCHEVFGELDALLTQTEADLEAFRKIAAARFFSVLPLPALLVVLLLLGGAIAFLFDFAPAGIAIAGVSFAILAGTAFALHAAGRKQGQAAAAALAAAIGNAGRIYEECRIGSEHQFAIERTDLQERYEHEFADIAAQWPHGEVVEREYAIARRQKLEQQIARVLSRNENPMAARLRAIESHYAPLIQSLEQEAASHKQETETAFAADIAEAGAEEAARWVELQAAWQSEIIPLYETLRQLQDTAEAISPEWSALVAEEWSPPANFAPGVKLGRLTLDLAQTPGSLPKDPRLALPGPALLAAPVMLTFPAHGSLLFETSDSGNAEVVGAINNVILRLFASMPPGKLSVTIIDPVGLGQNFAGLMHLGDYEESLINRRIWTQREQIEERLGEINEHIEKVIQMYLRNEYATITEYNAQAGSVAEKYQFLIIADFPANFSETAAKRLQSIVVSGSRCGVFTLIHWDPRQQPPDTLVPDELRKNSLCFRTVQRKLALQSGVALPLVELELDRTADQAQQAAFIHRIGKGSVDSNRVEVPFSQIAPAPGEYWTQETSSELKIAIGRTGATKLQYLAIGKGTRQHALFAGKTGSGKSTLFHVIITNLALACSPDQVEFYLIDFKKGVEFKCYAEKRLPHARVVAIESDREFGLSVLHRVDEELKRRGDLFRKLGVQDVAGYKREGGTEPMPRALLLIDEFQEFFVEDDPIAQNASLLFDRIVRQGRAFGIHVILGSQTLGGAYTLARATLGQMVIRVALQCNEADAYLIMDDNNSAARLLSRPGEGIYNDAAGSIEGNSPFQVVWLPDRERDGWLDKIRALAESKHDHHPSPVVFEGNAPAEIRENDRLAAALAATPSARPSVARAWLGAPNSIKGPTEAAFHRQSGHHLLIVGQREETALSLLGVSMAALAAQHPVGAIKLVFITGSLPDSAEAAFLDGLARAIPHRVDIIRTQELGDAMSELAANLKARTSAPDAGAGEPNVFVFIHGLQKFKKLRAEDEFSFSSSSDSGASAGAQLGELITEGSSHGIHLLVSLDTFNNVNRFLSRKAIGEFELRVLFQMSANDSASLIDSPKASSLGLHRALFYNEQAGYLETFRPYALPDAAWIEATAKALETRRIPTA